LYIVEIVSHHHLKDGEQLTIRDKAVIVDIVDLEGKAEFLLLRGSS